MRCIYLILIWCFLSCTLVAQYGLATCGDKCDSKDYEVVIDGLKKQTRGDSIRCYHLYANYKFSYKNDLDSTIYYLNLVHSMDPCYITKFYVVFAATENLIEDSKYYESSYFVNRVEYPDKKKYLQDHCLQMYIGGETENETDIFIYKLDSLDQSYRKKIGDLDKSMNLILDQYKAEFPEFVKLNQERDSILNIQESNDSIAFSMILEKFENEPAYFDRAFIRDEHRFFFTFFLHSGTKLTKAIPLLNYMSDNGNLDLSKYKLFIARYYCVLYGKSPFDCPHCETDSRLLYILKEEYPHFYQKYQNSIK